MALYQREAKENTEYLQPPRRAAFMAGHHWVEGRDFDGRSTGLVVLQWQPGVGAWCHSNNYATGNDLYLEANHWRYVCEAPMPDLENDKATLLWMKSLANQARRELKETGAITGDNLKTVEQLLMMISDPM